MRGIWSFLNKLSDRYKTSASSKRVKFSDDKFDQLNLNSSEDERASIGIGGSS